MSWPNDLQQILSDYYRAKAKITNWTGVQAVQALEDGHNENMKNREAESAAVRRQLWGSDESVKDDEMRQTILGDITHPAPIIMPQPPANQSPIPAILLATAAGVGGYFLATNKPDAGEAQKPTPIVQFDDETISVGLGRIGDYITDEPKQ